MGNQHTVLLPGRRKGRYEGETFHVAPLNGRPRRVGEANPPGKTLELKRGSHGMGDDQAEELHWKDDNPSGFLRAGPRWVGPARR